MPDETKERVDIDMSELLSDGGDQAGTQSEESAALDKREGAQAEPAAAPDTGTAPTRVELSPESMAQLAKTIGQAAPQSTTQEQPSLTPEQVKELLSVYEAGEADIAELGLPPTAAKKLNAVLQAVVKQAVTAASLHTELVRRQFEQTVAPLRSMHQEQQLAKLRTEFFDSHEDLKGRDRVVEMVYSQLSQNPNWKPTTKEQAFKDVATEARRVINDLLQGQGNNNGQANAGAGAPSGRRMPTVTAGGQAGGARGAAKTEPDKDRSFTRWLLDMNDGK